MFLLDTDIFTLYVHGNEKVKAKVESETSACLSIFTRIEILRGRFDFMLKAASRGEWLRAQHLLERWENWLSVFEVIPISDVAADSFEHLRSNKSLRKIGRGDLCIAAIALAHKATLITRNVKDFKLVPGLKYENWAD